jgi:hypothetical protein
MALIPLVHTLIDLLAGHGVEAVVKDGFVYLPQLDRWANLWMNQTDGGSYLVEIRATACNDITIADRCAAVGDTFESAREDGLRSFCSGTFHVLLAALWGVLERDQVDHEVRVVGHHAWDIYTGPCTLRTSIGAKPLVLPRELVDLVPGQLERVLVDSRVHAVRLYFAVLNGAVTVEALVDDEENPALAEVFASAQWLLPETGFASLRWFIAACPRTSGPSHHTERSACGG